MLLYPIFRTLEKLRGFRIILVLKEHNRLRPFKHFRMEMFEAALTLLKLNMWMCSIDLKDANYCTVC